MRRTAALAVLVLLLAGCGQKGPLYLPDRKPATVTPPAAAPAAQPAPAPAQPTQTPPKKDDDPDDDTQKPPPK